MSSRLEWSLGLGGTVFLIGMLLVALSMRSTPKARARAVRRFSERLDLWVPSESADWLAARLRRRGIAAFLLIVVFFTAWTVWDLYYFMLAPYSGKPQALPAMIVAAPVWAGIGVAAASGHLYDQARDAARPGPRVARLAEPRLSDTVPPILTWCVRGLAVLPVAAAVVWLVVPIAVQHAARPAHPHPILFAAAAILTPLSVPATELLQRRILLGRQNATTPQELAIDDALRSDAVLSLLIIPAAVCAVSAILVVAPLGSARSWSGAFPVFTAMTLAVLVLIGVNAASQAKWARRYYLARLARVSGGPAC